MPRNVRNAWVTVNADGVNEQATGPKSADGQCRVTIQYRENGRVAAVPIRVDIWPVGNGKIKIEVDMPAGFVQVPDPSGGTCYTAVVER